jgi:hypothetical protein
MDNTNKVDLEYCQQSSEDNHITEINAYYFARDNVSPSCSTSVGILLTPFLSDQRRSYCVVQCNT